MELQFASNQLKRCFESSSVATRIWGKQVGRKYIQCIGLLYSITSVADLYKFRSLRPHALSNNRSQQISVVLSAQWRLIITQLDDSTLRVEEVTNHYDD